MEIRRLRERIKCLEGDNATMHTKLSRTQKDVDARLAEIELQIEDHEAKAARGNNDLSSESVSCSLNSTVGEEEEEEKNRESFI